MAEIRMTVTGQITDKIAMLHYNITGASSTIPLVCHENVNRVNNHIIAQI